MNSGALEPHTEGPRGRPEPVGSGISNLEWRIKWTYRARLETSKRMHDRSLTWNSLLVTASTVTTIISIVLLADPLAYGSRGSVFVVVAGVLTLATSLLVTSANYAVRAQTFFRGYRDLQRLWVDVSQADGEDGDEQRKLEERYQQLLDQLPNHSEADYLVAKSKQPHSPESKIEERTFRGVRVATTNCFKIWRSKLATLLPVGISALMLLLLTPTVVWLLR